MWVKLSSTDSESEEHFVIVLSEREVGHWTQSCTSLTYRSPLYNMPLTCCSASMTGVMFYKGHFFLLFPLMSWKLCVVECSLSLQYAHFFLLAWLLHPDKAYPEHKNASNRPYLTPSRTMCTCAYVERPFKSQICVIVCDDWEARCHFVSLWTEIKAMMT